MKRFAIAALSILALTLILFGQSAPVIYEKVNTRFRLLWNANPPEDFVIQYHVFLEGVSVQTQRVVTNYTTSIPFTNLMVDLPNGTYTAWLTALGESGLESHPSEQIAIFWYGNRPSPPTFPESHFIE